MCSSPSLCRAGLDWGTEQGRGVLPQSHLASGLSDSNRDEKRPWTIKLGPTPSGRAVVLGDNAKHVADGGTPL